MEFQFNYFKRIPGFQVLVFDNRGTGFSEPIPEPPYSMYQMSGDLISLISHIGWDKYHLVGVSMGGMIAQHVALRTPEKILTLSLLCTRVEGGLFKMLPTFWGTVGFLKLSQAKTPEDVIKESTELFFPKLFLDSISPEGGSYREQIYSITRRRLEGIPATSEKAKKGQLYVVRNHGLNEAEILALKNFKFPKLAIVGDLDIVIPPEHSYSFPELIGAKLVVLKNAGHSIINQCPDEVNAQLRNFIEENITTVNHIHSDTTTLNISNVLITQSSETFSSITLEN
eukprot:TRINITY_DN2043_c0_g1_i7.p1 TRINITY_DN2043_c0_g1~~TRINITY_DN2043_c0_g1_i7.p1  ORF type:complete len:316 (+),score=56.37 TRINITY_DN2043_c0_g1_i7:97-948(+)